MASKLQWTEGNRLEPLIEGIPTYRALEKAILEAADTVHLAYWLIDPRLKTAVGGSGSNESAAGTWGELLKATVDRGVAVRLIIADFDPVLGFSFHTRAWRSFRAFWSLRATIATQAQARFQIICSRHEARVGTAIRILSQPLIQKALRDVIHGLNNLAEHEGNNRLLEELAVCPGLWPYIEWDTGRSDRLRPRRAMPTVYPAAHHEKLCVIDDKVVFLGGLDIDADRFDDQWHERHRGWHDVACRIDGPIANFFARHWRRRWNRELQDFQVFEANARAPLAVSGLSHQDALQPLSESVDETSGAVGDARIAPLQTYSSQDKSSFSRTPQPVIRTCLEGYEALIKSAEKFLYIENQFLRSLHIVDCMIARAEEASDLEILIVLPTAPDLALTNHSVDTATRHGQYLQDIAVSKLERALPGRVGIFTFKRQGAAAHDPECQTDKVLDDIVYVHAKVMIADDRSAVIGSANLNDRSLNADTETAVLWHEPAAVHRFRVELWHHALGCNAELTTEKPLSARWREHAERNAKLPPSERQGYVMPFHKSEQRAWRRRNWLIPEEIV